MIEVVLLIDVQCLRETISLYRAVKVPFIPLAGDKFSMESPDDDEFFWCAEVTEREYCIDSGEVRLQLEYEVERYKNRTKSDVLKEVGEWGWIEA